MDLDCSPDRQLPTSRALRRLDAGRRDALVNYHDYGSADVIDLDQWGRHRLAVHEGRTLNDLHSARIVRVIRHWKNLQVYRTGPRHVIRDVARQRKAS